MLLPVLSRKTGLTGARDGFALDCNHRQNTPISSCNYRICLSRGRRDPQMGHQISGETHTSRPRACRRSNLNVVGVRDPRIEAHAQPVPTDYPNRA